MRSLFWPVAHSRCPDISRRQACGRATPPCTAAHPYQDPHTPSRAHGRVRVARSCSLTRQRGQTGPGPPLQPPPASSATAEPPHSLRAPLHRPQTRTTHIGGLHMLRATFPARPGPESSPDGRDRPSPAQRRRGKCFPGELRRRRRPRATWTARSTLDAQD